MQKAKPYTSIIIGSGQAAPALAVKLASRGETVALVEADRLGGTCINNGCTPTKTLRKSARVAYLAGRASEFGINIGAIEIDFGKAMQRMKERVEASRDGLTGWLESSNVDIFRGWGKLAGKHDADFLVAVEGTLLSAPKIFLNTGTRPFAPPIAGLLEVPFLDNRSLLDLRERPDHLVIIGGSFIGLEMAQIFRRLGSKITVIEAGPRLASREDEDISEMIAEFLTDEGINIVMGEGIKSVEKAVDQGPMGCAINLEKRTIKGSHLLVATGRSPNTDALGLETVGIETNARGYVATNERLETTVAGIWALGDINARGAFTHTSYHDYEIVAENLAGGSRSADKRIMTYAMFTDPPLGHVGIHAHEATGLVADGRNILIAEHDMKDVSRAKEESELTGRIRMIVDGDSGEFLGATMLGINADEIIQIFVHHMAAGSHWQTMRNALPVHPTVAEFFPTILDKLQPAGAT